MKNLYKSIFQFFTVGNLRSIKLKKNILGSFFAKGLSIIVGFLLIRIALEYLDQTRFGIWLVIASFLHWVSFFDIGLGNGLRNKLSEALAVEDIKLAKTYVSTAYASVTLLISIACLLFIVANQFINWNAVVNSPIDLQSELTLISYIVFVLFFLRLILKLVGSVLFALQLPAIANLIAPLGHLIAVVTIFFLNLSTKGTLINLALAMSLSPIIVLIVFTLFIYKKKFSELAPSLAFIDFRYAKILLNLGSKFFYIRISLLILHQSSNIIIAQFFGPKEVIPYQASYRLFSSINMLFMIIMAPFWSVFTEAYTKQEFVWIKKSINKLKKVWLLFVLGAIVLVLISPWIYSFWLGNEINIPFELSALMALYFLLLTYGGIYNMFINGVGKIKLQSISVFVGALLFLASTFFFIKVLDLGVISLVLGLTVANFYSPFIAPLHYKKLITKTAKGIWQK